MDTSLVPILGLGFLLGVRHALDADHVAAVSTLVSQYRSVRVSCMLGTFWGLGHAMALLGAGAAMLAFRFTISPAIEQALETTVAVLLIVLGVHVVVRALVGRTPHTHGHERLGHRHAGEGSHGHGRRHGHGRLLTLGRRPFLIGVLHGLAGSGALMLLVLGTITSPAAAVLYIVVFGVGSTGGMLLLSGLVGLPFIVAGGRSATAGTVVQMLTGVVSAGLGVALLIA